MSESTSAVIGAGIVSFLPGISARHRDKVKLALAMAERSTEAAYREGLIEDWFAYYRNQLKYMGWDAVSAEQVHWPDEQRARQADQVLETIAATAGEHFASVIGISMHKLLANPTPLRELERRAYERQHFQLLPCAPAGANRVDMVLYHETDTRSAYSAGFISHKRSHRNVRAELVRFNLLAFEHSYLPKVQDRVVQVSLQRILDFDI
ncbi:hypothetical protein [Pseudomonas putida]|uniref:Uncharacterized protein n=1 Tax=Pseudomonas putida TaxID=303 RepID=A0AAW4BZ49_PSEPU|nr:hypothetical protein [Pseudomonas putida]MRF42728.1 hypothetical protein [Escherichia coli]MBF8700652.1 hypothetical protein [Pseudomonas putida]MBF8708642.1 hypothetical protein [Pseudomonas putida]MBF8737695.1 hypothetical protein [Pseudomonas putida]MDZ5109200.1 hypothetical protein [Pseudomonas putida]